jgi:tight adherence protein B
MFQSFGSNSFIVLLALVFVAVILLLEALYLIWQSYKGPEAKRIEQRLNALSASHDNSEQSRFLKTRMLSEVPAIERLLLDLPKAHRIQKTIHQAGLQWTVSRLILSSGTLGALLYLVMTSLAFQSASTGAIVGAAASSIPWFYVQRKRSRRLSKIEQQLPDALDLMIRALRSGHAFASGLKMLGDDMAEPIAQEFRIVHDEINFGVSLNQALLNLSERLPITDLRYFIVSVLIQRESGGNLTEVLTNLSKLIRERLKLRARIRVLSSEGRLSAWILGLMPFALAAIMNAFNPAFMSPLWTDPIGTAIIKYMLTLMAFGVLIMRKIVKVRI